MRAPHVEELVADARKSSQVADGVQLLIFPELSLTGYFLKDQTSDVALRRGEGPLERLAELSKEVSIAAGFVERGEDGQLYNAYGFWEDGELLGVHRKVHLVTYGMFEEHRDLGAGCEFAPSRSWTGSPSRRARTCRTSPLAR